MRHPIYTARMCRLRIALLLGLAATSAHAQFEMQDSTTTADLRGVISVGNGTAWASGTHGTVLRTEDSGFVWQGCTTPPGAEKLDFRGIQAFDDRTAIVMSSGTGDLSRIYKTADGCVTWKLVFTNPDAAGFFDAIQAATRNDIFVLGDPVRGAFTLWHSSDGGEHWARITDAGLAAQASTQGAFAASNSSLIAKGPALTLFGSGGKEGSFVYESSTAIRITGLRTQHAATQTTQHWTREPIPLLGGTESAGIFSIAADPRTGTVVAVGGDYKQPGLSRSTSARRESGRAWQASQTFPAGFRSAVAYDVQSKTWITVGPNGTDISRDGAKNWQPLHPGQGDQPDADRNWNALSLPFVVGPHGRIGRLRDDALTRSK